MAFTAERREGLGRFGGRSAFALFAEGGLYHRALFNKLYLDGYIQGGVVGARNRDLFVDGGATLTRPIWRKISGGIGVWGAAQPGLYRLDAGPRITMQVRRGIRVHADYRQRLVGNAAPAVRPRADARRGLLGRRALGMRRGQWLAWRRPWTSTSPSPDMSVNALLIIALGGLVGLLSGMFGVGGGFLTTPLLIFYGIPPTVAVASRHHPDHRRQRVGGVYAHCRRGGVDLKMGGVMIAGGAVGSLVGAGLFRLLQDIGPDRPRHRRALRRPARLDRRADAQGRAGRARLDPPGRRRAAPAPQPLGRRRCRCAGASTPRASTSRRSPRSRSASSPAS